MLLLLFSVAISFTWHLKQVRCRHVGARFKRVLCHRHCKYLQSNFFSFYLCGQNGPQQDSVIDLDYTIQEQFFVFFYLKKKLQQSFGITSLARLFI